jgi:prepilin-type N-terminal cleavage/methylation domain-containing protein
MLTKFTKNSEKGFTLIELMIVIAIIGILAAIAIPQFAAYRQRSYNSASGADLRNATTAQEAYFVDNQMYTAGIANIAGPTYGLYTSQNVVLSVVAATTSGYNMTAYHNKGNVTWTIVGPGGSLTK